MTRARAILLFTRGTMLFAGTRNVLTIALSAQVEAPAPQSVIPRPRSDKMDQALRELDTNC